MTREPKTIALHEPGSPAESFPRWIMSLCPSCGGVIVASSPTPHPSFAPCTCKPEQPSS